MPTPTYQSIQLRLQTAWAALTPEQRASIKPLFEAANDQHIALRTAGGILAPSPDVPHNLMMVKTALTNDWDGLLDAAGAEPLVPIAPKIGPEGEIYGFKKFEQLDPGWLESVAVWLENLNNIYPFPSTTPPVISIPDNVTIALAGDWGTGNWRTAGNPSPSAKVAAAMSNLKPNVTIHLGDVYYAGTNQQETDFLVGLWPAGYPDPALTFTMNSNHEMYSGANPYFKVALASKLFSKQAGHSVFALENTEWVIVCLDSAYFSDKMKMYLSGNIDSSQLNFLAQQVAKNKKVIIVTHHNGYDDGVPVATAGAQPINTFYNTVMSAFPTGRFPAYWYWGHVHTGVVYKADVNGVLCRCAGHGAIPWAQASVLAAAKAAGTVVWYETRNANDPDVLQRMLNGFTVLQLNNSSITETFYDESGGVAWSSV